MIFLNKILIPTCNSLKATSFIMPDEGKKKVRVVVGGESSRHVDASGAAPDVDLPFFDQLPPDLPIIHEDVVSEEARRLVEDEGTEVDDESDYISVGGPLSIVGECESEGVILEETVGRAGLISETETALNINALRIC